MGITKTLGGDRLGAGKKQKVHMHGYERSTHDLGYIWRSTMAAGTLVPFMKQVALPGDTFDIDLDVDIKTHPTIGPLFGSYKIQLDVFTAPIRLYQAQLHNNKLGIGLNMSNIKLPVIELEVVPTTTIATDIDNSQINPSCILSFLGIRGVGIVDGAEVTNPTRTFNGVPLLAYWDIYKNYYANKQEEIGYVIHWEPATPVTTVSTINIFGVNITQGNTMSIVVDGTITDWTTIVTSLVSNTPLDQIVLLTSNGNILMSTIVINNTTVGLVQTGQWSLILSGNLTLYGWDYISGSLLPILPPTPTQFNLSDIDDMRENILAAVGTPTAFDINATNLEPYSLLLDTTNGPIYTNTQEGLGLKTYQSDLFNNWLQTDWIDGVGGINDITAIDTSGGSFNIDTLILARKVYDMLNRIAVSGGTYDDWLDTVWDHERYWRAETPVYHGGLIRELVFQEVVSNSTSETALDSQPLGTLAGKGIMAGKKKGGSVTIKVDEPSYIIGIISLTPRVDYSQGNDWDTHLETMDDLHKPGLDEIGFQEDIVEQRAWWSTGKELGVAGWIQKSAGKQPAWINYMTNVNQTRGNFAITENEMFMTLNRRFEWNETLDETSNILDLTTYIDPSKFNFIFAQTSIDAQNFWAQIAVDITARRKMSAKVMPNL